MPRRRDLHKYPREYFDLFEDAQAGTYELSFESQTRARYIRDELYNLRAAMRDALSLDPTNVSLCEQYILIENVVIRLDNNKLKFSTRKYSSEDEIRRARAKATQTAGMAESPPTKPTTTT